MGLELKDGSIVIERNGASLVSKRLKGVPLATTWGDFVTREAGERLNWSWSWGVGDNWGVGWCVSRVVLNFN